jgi:hypothetical protein
MYTATLATGVKKGVSQKWQTIDISTILVKDLYDQYRKVYLTLELDTPVMTVYLDMDSVRPQYSTFAGTVEQMLIDNGNTTLPALNTLPDINTRTARYMDAFRAGYSIMPYNAVYGTNVAMSDRLDVLLSRSSPTLDYTTFFNTTLVSVNGLYHRTDTNGSSGIVVYKAAQSQRKSNQNQMGLLTFHGMCNITTHTITPGMIEPLAPDTPLSSGLYLHSDVDLTNKSVLFVIGGYLHTLSSLITKVGDSSFRIDIPNYPLFDRFYEMRNHLDISGFDLSVSTVNETQVSVEELQTDANLIALLTMSQSFIVVLDCPEIYWETHYVRKTGIPGSYIAYTDPKYPLVTGLGRHTEYWYRLEDGQYALTVYDNAVSNRIYNTVDPYFENSISDSELPTDPVYLSGAYFLMIARDI